MKPIYTIHLPEYKVDQKPDFDLLGSKVDSILKENHLNQKIVVRVISSEDHPGKSVEELVQIIQETGFDRYDPKRKGDRYENIEGKSIDFFAMEFLVGKSGEYFKYLLEPFYTWREKPVRIDVVMVYDSAKLEVIEHQYAGREGEVKKDGYVFKDQANRLDAVLSIIVID